MQGAEHQVAGFRSGQRQADGFQVAHLAHENDIRIFAQGTAQGVVEGQRVRSHLALVDQAFLRFMHELDRILDGQDMSMLVLVDVIHHCRQGGRLARAGRPRHQHDAAGILGYLLEYFRAVQFFQGQHLRGNGTEHGTGATVLDEGIDTETREIRNGKGKVAFQILFVVLALSVVHDVVHHAVYVLVLHRRQVDATHISMHADHGRQAG